MALKILYRDDRVIAIDKPPGLLVHRSNLDRQASAFAVQLLRDQIGHHVWPAHRLDRGTSGVLLFGLDREAGQLLSRQFEERQIDKRYLAVVRGHPPVSGVIDHPLRPVADARIDPPSSSENAPAAARQSALTHFHRLATCELPWPQERWPTSRYALMALEPVSGRRHQLRRHMKHLSHPIIGDATYGKGWHNRQFAAELGCARLLLACFEMSFRDLHSGQSHLVRAPLDGEFLALITTLGWPLP